MKIENEAKREIERIDKVLKKLKVVNSEGNKIFELVKSYHSDAKHFFDRKKFLQAFEASIICWAYIDSGLHLGIFEIPKEFSKLFTIE